MALLVRSAPEPPVTVPVPAATADQIAKYASSYLMAYWTRRTQPDGWSQTVDSVTRWAFDVIAPVLEHLTVTRLVLIPCGLLARASPARRVASRPGSAQRPTVSA